ncbi:hypothetical protein [Streptomyces osmaniensis]|uniref:hypothetical protein n=1 Tax=Streptomyces osmaniensis TaxID=593134 RepID=UPI001C320AB2|nr:hypothetical protein KJK32_45190 [Streptomyces sp. JCM17656]
MAVAVSTTATSVDALSVFALPVFHQLDRTDLHGQSLGQRLLVRDRRGSEAQGLTLGSPADQ